MRRLALNGNSVFCFHKKIIFKQNTAASARLALEPKGLTSLVVLIHHTLIIFKNQNSRRWIRTTVGRARIFSPAARRSGINYSSILLQTKNKGKIALQSCPYLISLNNYFLFHQCFFAVFSSLITFTDSSFKFTFD